MPWPKWKHPSWIQVYESSLYKEDYQKELVCDTNERHHHSSIKLDSKRGTRIFVFTHQKGRIIGDAKLTGVDTSVNQEPPQTQLLENIEVTTHIGVRSLEDIPYIDLAINPNNEETTPKDTPKTLEPPQLLKSLGTAGDIPVQEFPTTQNISQPKHDIPGERRSTRVRTQTKSYSPSLSGNKYSHALTQT